MERRKNYMISYKQSVLEGKTISFKANNSLKLKLLWFDPDLYDSSKIHFEYARLTKQTTEDDSISQEQLMSSYNTFRHLHTFENILKQLTGLETMQAWAVRRASSGFRIASGAYRLDTNLAAPPKYVA